MYTKYLHRNKTKYSSNKLIISTFGTAAMFVSLWGHQTQFEE